MRPVIESDFPMYAAEFTQSGFLLIGGGGGASNAGVPNTLVGYIPTHVHATLETFYYSSVISACYQGFEIKILV